jgi:tetratricopeptide (TPR) repeat protein
VFDKRNRWVAIAVVSVGVLAFVGFSVVLPFSGAFIQSQQQQRTASSPTPSASPGKPSQEELEATAKGYELVLQREPENQTALRGLVDVRIQQGSIDKVIGPLEKLAALNPDQPDYTVLLAQAKQRTGDREGAAQAYRSILSTRPGDLNALKGLSDLLVEQQRPEAAVGLLEDTLKTADQANQVKAGSVDVTSVQLLLGEVYAAQGRFDEALAIYDRAIQSNGQDFRPVLGKAILLKTQGKTDEAKPLFASAAALAPPQFKDQINQLATSSPSPSASPSPPSASPSSSAGSSPGAQSEANPTPEATTPAESPTSEENSAPATPATPSETPPAGE